MVEFHVSATKPNIKVDLPDYELKFNNKGWAVDEIGPENVVKGYSNVFIRDKYKLVAYQYCDGMGGNSIIWALPKENDAPLPQDCEILREEFLHPPKPSDAVDYMNAIDGDRTPLSYIQAAILVHELNEYGAYWHGVNWGRDRILPIHNEYESSKYEWTLLEREPEIIHPHFYYNEDQRPVVIFYTINDIGVISMKEYKHIFSEEDYTLYTEVKVIATAGVGIIF